MKKIVYLLTFFIFVLSFTGIYSQIQTFGILRNSTTPAIQLATINPVSGNVTTISAVSFANSYVVNGLATIDPFNKIYYLQAQGKLFGIDMTNGTTTTTPNITLPPHGHFDMMVFNCSDTTVYGIFRDDSVKTVQLAKIAPATGVVTVISPSSFASSFSLNGWATIDRVNGVYYIQSDNKLWGISLSTGAVLSSPILTYPSSSAYFDMMIYNNNNGTLYGISRTSSPASIRLGQVNVSTGVVSNISVNSFANFFGVNTGSAIDPVNGVYYIQSGGQFWGLDLTTGTVVSSPNVNVPSGSYFDMMEMNINNCNGSYQVGVTNGIIENASSEDFRIFPNPAKHAFLIKNQGSGSIHVVIKNTMGQKVFDQLINPASEEINTSAFPKGIYYCTLEEGNRSTTRKVILE